MDHETTRALIGTILLLAMAIAAAAFLIRKNWAKIKEICLDENSWAALKDILRRAGDLRIPSLI